MDKKERADLEAMVDRYVARSDTEKAIKALFDLIVDYAREKDFAKAEALHNRMYDVDSMALTEIVRAGEVIEEEKSGNVDQEHLEIWNDLHRTLSTTEANALYYSMKSKTYDVGEPIMEQGKFNSRLFFINKGEVKALIKQGDKELLITKLGMGSIIGQTPFFTATVCTVSFFPMTRVKLTYLETDVLKKWKTDVPALESKLLNYCLKNDPVKKELDGKSIERREDQRVDISGKVVFQLLDRSGNLMGKGFGGELSDISAGGLSFIIKSSKKESIRMLLGRHLKVSFVLPLKNHNFRNVEQNMTVIAAQPQVFDDYSVHLKFDTKWAQKMIDEIDATRVRPAAG